MLAKTKTANLQFFTVKICCNWHEIFIEDSIMIYEFLQKHTLNVALKYDAENSLKCKVKVKLK